MHVIAKAYANTHATTLMCVKNSLHHLLVYGTDCLGHWNEENERRNKSI